MINSIYQKLLNHFGEQGWWPTINPKTGKIEYHSKRHIDENKRFEIILGAILTQNTSWKNAEKAILNLRKNKLLSKEKLNKIPVKKLSSLIKSSGYYNQKARKIKEFLAYKGLMKRQKLLGIWGLGPETVDSILLYAYNRPVFVIDSYTKRIFSRLMPQTSKLKTYEGWQKFFESKLPKNAELFKEYHALIVHLAKENCRKNPECVSCPLREQCKSFR